MNFKIDENLPTEIAGLLTKAGHPSSTVLDQGFGGSVDPKVMTVCIREDRALVTLDLDFSDIRTYPPQNLPGIVVLRGADQSKWSLLELSRQITPTLASESLKGQLWIVEPGRVRIRGSRE